MWMKQAISLQLSASNPLTSQLKLAAKIQSQVQKGRAGGSIEYTHGFITKKSVNPDRGTFAGATYLQQAASFPTRSLRLAAHNSNQNTQPFWKPEKRRISHSSGNPYGSHG